MSGWLKDKKLFVIQTCAVLGSLLFFALPKTTDYKDELLFSQTRMFLYIPYVLLIVVFFYGMQIKTDTVEKYRGVILGLGIMLCMGKSIYFKTSVINEQDLYQSSVTAVWGVDNIYELADYFNEVMKDNGCNKLVVTHGSSAMAYAVSATNHGEYLTYMATYDRRTPIYLKLKEEVLDEYVLFVSVESAVDVKFRLEEVKGTTLIDYLRVEKGLQRYTEGDERYIN